MNGNKEVGFSQRIQLEWLERTAELALAGKSREEILNELQELLRNRLSVGGKSLRGNREKAITILLKTWVTVPKKLEPFRNDGFEHLKRLPLNDHLPMHWGMIMVIYPFFATVAETVGRLLRLQSSCTTTQVLRRVLEHYGERETVDRAARRILRCLVDWGVLQDINGKGVYQPSSIRRLQDERLVVWLIEAVLLSTNSDSMLFSNLVRSPSLFPFAFESMNILSLENNNRLQTFPQAIDENVVMLRNISQSN